MSSELPCMVSAQKCFENEKVNMVAAGYAHTCCVTASGVVWVWGLERRGQPAQGAAARAQHAPPINMLLRPPDKMPPQLFAGVPAVMVACGYDFTLVLSTRGKVWSFGVNREGQLGVGDCDERPQAVPVGDEHFRASTIVMVAAGDEHCIAADARGVMYTWGADNCNALGLGEGGCDGNASHPRAVYMCPQSPGAVVVFVAAGGNCSMAIDDFDQVWAWGQNHRGQLGLGHLEQTNTPAMVYRDYDQHRELFVTVVACGGQHTLFVTTEGELLVSGHNMATDRGFPHDIFVPTATTLPFGGARQIVCASAGEGHSAVVDERGTLYTWGEGRFEYDPNKYGHRDFAGGVGHGGEWTSAPTAIAKGLLQNRRVGWYQPLPMSRFQIFALGSLPRVSPPPTDALATNKVRTLPATAMHMIRFAARRSPGGQTDRLLGLSRLLGAGADYSPPPPSRGARGAAAT
jgi:alpha-tubulin suppressor-like RCC1 family protein